MLLMLLDMEMSLGSSITGEHRFNVGVLVLFVKTKK